MSRWACTHGNMTQRLGFSGQVLDVDRKVVSGALRVSLDPPVYCSAVLGLGARGVCCSARGS